MDDPRKPVDKWKTAFWCCLLFTLVLTALSVYVIIDQSVSLTYMREGYGDTERDLEIMMSIINETDQTKSQIDSLLSNNDLYEYTMYDTVSLNRIELIFAGDRLRSVRKQW